jgi:hypothetical protein
MKATLEWLESAITKCLACREPLVDGDLVLHDVSGEWLHAACCGPERESYVKDADTGEPLGPDDAIPTGDAWPIVADHDDRRLKAVLDVLGERLRQVDGEGWTPEHDDEYVLGEMAGAAGAYALWDKAGPRVRSRWDRENGGIPNCWPWAPRWWKPKDRRSNLVRAGALILAEIERLDRAGAARG